MTTFLVTLAILAVLLIGTGLYLRNKSRKAQRASSVREDARLHYPQSDVLPGLRSASNPVQTGLVSAPETSYNPRATYSAPPKKSKTYGDSYYASGGFIEFDGDVSSNYTRSTDFGNSYSDNTPSTYSSPSSSSDSGSSGGYGGGSSSSSDSGGSSSGGGE